MSKASFSGPVRVGTVKEGVGRNVGTATLVQDVAFTVPANIVSVTDADGFTQAQYLGAPAVAFAAFGVGATGTINLPANANIIDIIIDVPVAIVGPTAANVTAGITAAGTEYFAATNVVAGGRVRPTFTAAQLLALMNVGSNLVMNITLTGTVANFTAGAVYVQVIYAQA